MYFTTDQGANIVCAVVKHLKKDNLPCMAHAIHNMLLEGMKIAMNLNNTIKNLIEKGNFMSITFRK